MLSDTRKFAVELFNRFAISCVCFFGRAEVLQKNYLSVENNFGSPLQTAFRLPDSLEATAITFLHALITNLLCVCGNAKIFVKIVQGVVVYVITCTRIAFFQAKQIAMQIYNTPLIVFIAHFGCCIKGLGEFHPHCVPFESLNLFVPMRTDPRNLSLRQR